MTAVRRRRCPSAPSLARALAVLVMAGLASSGCVRLGFDQASARDSSVGEGRVPDSRPLGDSINGVTGDGGSGGWQIVPPEDCTAPVWPTTAHTVTASPSSPLRALIDAAGPDTTILLDDGTYPLPGGILLDTERVVLRGTSGDASKVTIDVQGAEVAFIVRASQVVVANLSIVNARSDAVKIGELSQSISQVVLYNLQMQDVADHFVHVVPGPSGQEHYVDDSVVACSTMLISDAFRATTGNQCRSTGISLASGRGWRIVGNRIEGTWCPSLLVAAIQLGMGSRDALIERNVVLDANFGVRLGLRETAPEDSSGRSYPDDPCSTPPTSDYVDNYGGVVRNNFIASRKGMLYADSGIAVWNSCDSVVVHNSVFFAQVPKASSIEWRFPNTTVKVFNNLTSHALLPRDGATAEKQGNITGAEPGWFVDSNAADLHLTSTANAALDKGVSIPGDLCLDDIDGQARGAPPDVGADER